MIALSRTVRLAAVAAVLGTAFTGCVVAGGGGRYDDTVGVSYGVGFYEPLGYDYGGWGPGYHVGPPRGGEHGRERSGRSYRPAPPSHRTPSIPTRSHPRR